MNMHWGPKNATLLLEIRNNRVAFLDHSVYLTLFYSTLEILV